MVLVTKKNKDQLRVCANLRRLNKSEKREKSIVPTIDDILTKLAAAQVLSLSDAASGLWQIPLDKESAKLTTFITPFGRYYLYRLPFGITSSPDIFRGEMTEPLKDQEGVAIF